jgi:hypothetical protein
MRMTVRIHVMRTAMSTAGYGVTPAGFARLLAPRLQSMDLHILRPAIPGATMNTDTHDTPDTHDTLDTLTADQLVLVHGGISAAANWIMQHESGGSTTAGHLYSVGRGDGTPGNHSSAFGAFQMIQSTRKQYMGKDYQSTDFAKQYSAATHYVNDRYGSWEAAQSFWKAHHWY